MCAQRSDPALRNRAKRIVYECLDLLIWLDAFLNNQEFVLEIDYVPILNFQIQPSQERTLGTGLNNDRVADLFRRKETIVGVAAEQNVDPFDFLGKFHILRKA